MIGRITNTQILQNAQRNMQVSLQKLSTLQEQGTSQMRIQRPSDDPAGTAESLRVRGAQSAVEQYQRNAVDGIGWLSMVDQALSTSTTLLQRARVLVTQGSNDGVLSANARNAIATELEGIRADMLTHANTTYNGRSIFAGTSDAPAFDAAYAFSGSPTGSVERRVSPNETVRVDADGSQAFGEGANSVFALLDTIVSDLRSGAPISGYLDDIQSAMQNVLTVQSVAGARYAQLERAQNSLADQKLSLEARRSAVEDVDLAEVLVQLSAQQTAYQTALGVTARVLQPTLMSFLS